MNILVCVKQVPGTSRVNVDPETGVLLRVGVPAKLNPYDLYALEAAVRLRDGHGGKVTALTMGPEQAEGALREAFSVGADEGYLLTDRRFAGADVLATSYTLSRGVRKLGKPDLILCGQQTTDGDTAQVGPELAEFLDIPSAANVARIVGVSEDRISVAAEFEEYISLVTLPFPCLLSVGKGIYQPRLPSYRRKKAMADAPVTRWTLDDIEADENRCGLDGSPTKVRRIFPPNVSGGRELWQGSSADVADKLLNMLAERKLLP